MQWASSTASSETPTLLNFSAGPPGAELVVAEMLLEGGARVVDQVHPEPLVPRGKLRERSGAGGTRCVVVMRSESWMTGDMHHRRVAARIVIRRGRNDRA